MGFFLERIKSVLDGIERAKINRNFDKIEKNFNNVVDLVSERAYEKVVDAARLNWLEPVDTFTELAVVYPDAGLGDAVMVRDSGIVYRYYNNGGWQPRQEISVGPLNAMEKRFNTQLVQTKQAAFINVKDFEAKGDYDFTTNSGTDDTLAFKFAKALADTLHKKVYVPAGKYLISETYVIEDFENSGLFGDGKDQSILVFDLAEGQTAIEANTHYFRQSEVRDLRIQNRNENLIVNGIRIGPSMNANWSWGAACNLVNVDIARFTGVFLLLDEAFNGSFENSRFYGVYNSIDETIVKGTALKITSSHDAYNNLNNFKNCVFHLAKMGIQNLRGTLLKFDTCTFESMDLFHHLQSNERVTPFEIFENCWFEKIRKGIINAEINEVTLTPITPIIKKISIDNIIMQNNYQSGFVATPFIDPTVNADTNWSVINGWIYGKVLPFRSVTLLNGWTGSLEYQKNDRGLVMIKVYIKPRSDVAVGSTSASIGKIANIESGFRPNSTCVIPVRDASGNIRHIFIKNDGDVVVANDSDFKNTDNYTGNVTYYGSI